MSIIILWRSIILLLIFDKNHETWEKHLLFIQLTMFRKSIVILFNGITILPLTIIILLISIIIHGRKKHHYSYIPSSVTHGWFNIASLLHPFEVSFVFFWNLNQKGRIRSSFTLLDSQVSLQARLVTFQGLPNTLQNLFPSYWQLFYQQ